MFPKNWLQLVQRDIIPLVPACSQCDDEKSRLENYLVESTTLEQENVKVDQYFSTDFNDYSGSTPQADSIAGPALLMASMSEQTMDFEQELGDQTEIAKLEKLIGYIGFGLIWHHWQLYLPLDKIFKVFTPSTYSIEILDKIIRRLTPSRVVQVDLGENVINYTGMISEMDEGISIWAIHLLEGISITDEYNHHLFYNRFVAVITGTKTTHQNFSFQFN